MARCASNCSLTFARSLGGTAWLTLSGVPFRDLGMREDLGTTPAPELTTLASPRRLKVSAPGGAAEAALSALVHVSDVGRCDRFVILDLPSGLSRWLSAYLATWRLEPARRGGEPVETWVHYSGRVALELSGLQSISARTLADRSYDPIAESVDLGE